MKINKFNLIIGILYVVGFVLVMLNFLTNWLNFAAICVFAVATVMLTVTLAKFCVQRNAYLSSENEEIIMELALEDGEEKYIAKEKKQSGFKKFIENVRIFSPCIVSGVFACALILLIFLSLF